MEEIGNATLYLGDALEGLAQLEDESVHTCITSPPYWGLRDYGHDGQIGLEPTLGEFLDRLVAVFDEVRRVLRSDGTLWLNMGDAYSGPSGGGQGQTGQRADRSFTAKINVAKRGGGLKPKDLVGLPWRLAFALQDAGWYLRQDIIWHKPNPMPESVRDRCTKAHEYLFLMSKSPRYYFDQEAIKEPATFGEPNSPQSIKSPHGQGYERRARAAGNKSHKYVDAYDESDSEEHRTKAGLMKIADTAYELRNKRSVWTVSTVPYPEAHFATFPTKLVEPCVLAGSAAQCCGSCGAPWSRQTERVDSGYDGSRYGERAVEATGGAISGGTSRSTLGSSNGKQVGRRRTVGFGPSCQCGGETVGGLVLDPFAGSGTTGQVALEHGRRFIGIELNPEYMELIRRRVTDAQRQQRLFA